MKERRLMNDKLEIIKNLSREQAEAYSAGAADGNRFWGLYRAYLQGAYDASGFKDQDNHDSLIRLALAAMTFAFLGWVFMMIMVFK